MATQRKLIGGALSFRTTPEVKPGGFTVRRSYESRRFHIHHEEIIQAARQRERLRSKAPRVA